MFKGFLEDTWDGIGEYVLHFYYPSQDKVSYIIFAWLWMFNTLQLFHTHVLTYTIPVAVGVDPATSC